METKTENPITTELAKQNVTEAVIANLRDNYLPLRIDGINDKEGYDKVHKARIECRDIRILAEKVCKKGREDAIKIQKEWTTKEKQVVGQISEVEQYLKKQEDGIDTEKENLRIRAERLLKLPGRKTESVGMQNYFTMELTDENIMSFTDADWTQLLLMARSRKLDEQQKIIDDANKAARLNRLTERTNILYAESVSMRSANGRKEFIKGNIHYSEDEIADMPQEQWDRICSEFKSAVMPPKPEQTTWARPLTPTPAEPPVKEISDEEKLFNFASAIEKLPRPGLITKAGRTTLVSAELLIAQAIELLRK